MQVGISVGVTSNPFRVAVSVSGTLTLDSLTYTRGTAGVAPDLNSTVSSTGTVTGNYTLYWATRSTGTALSKAAIENGTGDALDSGSVTAATLAGLDASLDLANSLTNGAIDAFIRDSSATPIESAVASVTGVNYDAAAPVFASAEVGTVDATSLIVTFDKAVYGSTSAADWDVQVAGAAATESAAVIDGATVDITLGAAVTSGQTVTVAYNGTGIVGIDAEQSATFTAQSVTNNVGASSDTAVFTDAGGTDGSFIDSSVNWTQITFAGAGRLVYLNNQIESEASAAGTSDLSVYEAQGTFANDQYIEFDLVSVSGTNRSEPIVRLTDDNNYYKVNMRDTQFSVFKKVAGSFTTLVGNTAHGATLPFRARFEVVGTTLKVLVDGVEVWSMADAAHSTGKPGLGKAGVVAIDNVEVGTIS